MTAYRWSLAALVLALPGVLSAAEPKYEVVLKRAFVGAIQDRTSIAGMMSVRHSHPDANEVGEKSQDGDLHFSGESPAIKLPFVAEIVNAAQKIAAVDFVKATADFNEKHKSAMRQVRITGAWRLWFEHPSGRQVQGSQNPFVPDNTNPDHLFEVHPVATIDQFDVHDSFASIRDVKKHPPTDFIAYPAETAFPYFDKINIRLKASNSGVTIRSQRVVYNYVQFYAELTAKPKKAPDGYIAVAEFYDASGEQQSPIKHRMIFVEGTKGAEKIKDADVGDRFHVLGIPRINLNAVTHLVSSHGTQEFSAVLPYEMIIVGIYPK